jgi:hypothetical protein
MKGSSRSTNHAEKRKRRKRAKQFFPSKTLIAVCAMKAISWQNYEKRQEIFSLSRVISRVSCARHWLCERSEESCKNLSSTTIAIIIVLRYADTLFIFTFRCHRNHILVGGIKKGGGSDSGGINCHVRMIWRHL